MIGASHLREVLRWGQDDPLDWGLMAAGGFGMLVPLWLAAANGHLELGLGGAVGSLLMGNSSNGRTREELARNEIKIFATLCLAAVCVALIVGHGFISDLAVVGAVAVAAVIGGYSNRLSMATSRFIVYLCIMLSAGSGHESGLIVFVLMIVSAAWTSFLIVAFGAITRAIRPPSHLSPATNSRPATPAELRTRWFASLRTLRGWQFAIRITVCLLVSVAIATIWPTHRYFWVAITVALICQRPLETWPVRTTQRAIGTLIGVGAAYILLATPPPVAIMIAALGIICALRLAVRSRNYLVFSALMTPVIMMILDAGRPVEINLLVDRIAATLMAAALVILVNALMVRAIEAQKLMPTTA